MYCLLFIHNLPACSHRHEAGEMVQWVARAEPLQRSTVNADVLIFLRFQLIAPLCASGKMNSGLYQVI